MAKTMAQFAVGMANLATGLPRDMEVATEKSALKLTTAARASIAQAAGGDSRLSGQGSAKLRGGKGGAKVGARYDMAKAGVHGRSPSALVKMSGPLPLLDNPVPPHEIRPKVKRGRANSLQRSSWIAAQEGRFMGVKPLRFKDGSYRFGARHPGTRGKRSFWSAVERTQPQMSRIFQAELVKAMSGHLK